MRPVRPGSTSCHQALAACAAALAVALFASGCRDKVYEPVILDDPRSFWSEGGFVEMVPAIRPPTGRGKNSRIQVMVKLPAGEKITVAETQHGPVLDWPTGTWADRVESLRDEESGRWAVGDVRGTKLDAEEGELFHVYRPVEPGFEGGPLFGYEWQRSRAAAGTYAHKALAKELAAGKGFVGKLSAKRRRQRIAALKLQGRCALCHVHDKAEAKDADVELPFRRADHDGFYGPMAVLASSAPLETYRPRDVNHESPWVEVFCEKGEPEKKTDDKGGVRFACPDKQLARARLDVARALAAGDEHAEAVCASRRWLHEHMDAKARQAFAEAFAACGIGDSAPSGAGEPAEPAEPSERPTKAAEP